MRANVGKRMSLHCAGQGVKNREGIKKPAEAGYAGDQESAADYTR